MSFQDSFSSNFNQNSHISTIKKSTKNIKVFKTTEERLFNVSFQTPVIKNIITYAVTSMNFETKNNISILSFDQDLSSDSENEGDEEKSESEKNNFDDGSDNVEVENGKKGEGEGELVNSDQIKPNTSKEHPSSTDNHPLILINKTHSKPSPEPTGHSLEPKLIDKIESKFPVSSLLFSPFEKSSDLFITTSDKLKLYSYKESKITPKETFITPKKECGPLTSSDWCMSNEAIVGVSSLDSTCSLFDLNASKLRNIFVACEREVYDLSFGQNENLIMTACADGTIRNFDMRTVEYSIVNETDEDIPMVRVKWNRISPDFVLCIGLDKNKINIYDLRNQSNPYAILKSHTNVVNDAVWAPNSNTNLLSVSDDKKAFIWDIYTGSGQQVENVMKYETSEEIESCFWGERTENWVGITHGRSVEVLRVK